MFRSLNLFLNSRGKKNSLWISRSLEQLPKKKKKIQTETFRHVTFPLANTPDVMLAHVNLSSWKQLLFLQQDIFHQETKVLLHSEISGSANIMSILLGFIC